MFFVCSKTSLNGPGFPANRPAPGRPAHAAGVAAYSRRRDETWGVDGAARGRSGQGCQPGRGAVAAGARGTARAAHFPVAPRATQKFLVQIHGTCFWTPAGLSGRSLAL